jgi:exonuclease SbcC
MRIADLRVEGFRGFAAAQSFDLDADAVIIVGVNGSGKTSMLDAILWALTGHLPRVEELGGNVHAGYAPNGETRVMLKLREGNQSLEITRSQLPEEKESRLSLDRDGSQRRGVSAEVGLLESLWPAGLDAIESAGALSAALTRSVYLQQDRIRQFVEADSDRDRFDALSELAGAGRLRELYVQFEQAKRAWTTTTNALVGELSPMADRLASLRSQLEGSTAEPDPQSDAEWENWWRTAKDAGVDVTASDIHHAEAPDHLDSALRQLSVLTSSLQGRTLALDELSRASPPEAPDDPSVLQPLELRHRATQAELAAATARVSAARENAAARAHARETERDHTRQLAELARIALGHLGERCPVCTQGYDREHTVAHLKSLIDAVPDQAAATAPIDDTLPDLVAEMTAAENAEKEAQAALETYHEASIRSAAALDARQRRLTEVGLDATADHSAVSEALKGLTAQLTSLNSLRTRGEALALVLARQAQEARRDELSREADVLAQRTTDLEAEIRERNLTGDLAQRLIEAIRDASADVVGMQLEHIGPLLERLYSRIDPHPALRRVSLRSWTERGRGRLRARLDDPAGSFNTDQPATVLSSSQLNGFAVSTFLAMNIGVGRAPLQTVMLDDPLQSLDDVNLLGLVDLMRRLKDRRQLIVTTHDARFGDLLERKVRALDGQRTVRIDLSGWSRTGPAVAQRDIPTEHNPLKLVA